MSLREHLRDFSRDEMRHSLRKVFGERLPAARERSVVIVYDRSSPRPEPPPHVEAVLYVPDNKRGRA